MMRVFGINVFLLFLQELCNSKDERGVTIRKCVKVPLEVVYKSERLLTGEVTDKNWFFALFFENKNLIWVNLFWGARSKPRDSLLF